MVLEAPQAPWVRVVHNVTGAETYVTLTAYRQVYYAAGWRSPVDDPAYVGGESGITAAGLIHGYGLLSYSSFGVLETQGGREPITCTADVAVNTKGAWVNVTANTDQDYEILKISPLATGVTAVVTSTLLDVGVAPAGSPDGELDVVVQELGVGYGVIGNIFVLPVHIPAGSRVAVRCQSVTTLKTVTATYAFGTLASGLRSPDALVTMGSVPGQSRGTLVVPGTDAWGAWAEIEDSTSVALGALLPVTQGGGDASLITGEGIYQVGIGAAGFEQVLISGIQVSISSSELRTYRDIPLYRASVPQGSRLAARGSHSTAGSGADMTLIGVPA